LQASAGKDLESLMGHSLVHYGDKAWGYLQGQWDGGVGAPQPGSMASQCLFLPRDIIPELMPKSVLPHAVPAAHLSSILSLPAGILNFTGLQKFVSQHHQRAANKSNDFCNSFPYTSGCIIHRDSTLVSKGLGTIAWAS